jgi:hypothetical protein
MATRSRPPEHPAPAESGSESEGNAPDVSVCESCPGRTVFLESGNTDGWIASDTTVEITR